MSAPKLFISYSWSNASHVQRVIELASSLVECGIEVIFDKWDLKEGHDAYAFMEKMVTDPSVTKVAIISDRIYSEKADGRSGGVGTETQIISKEVYDQQQQEKFVVVVMEKDADGKPYVPTYYRSRIYINLSEADSYAENYEQLVRWVFNKPLYRKPAIGKAPSYIQEDHPIQLGTSSSCKRAINAIKESKPSASGALNDYLTTFIDNLERFRILERQGEFDDLVVKSIEDFTPYRNEFIQLLITISIYSQDEDYINLIHRFFEQLIPYLYKPPEITSWREWDFDNFRFIVHELFLYTIAIFLKDERFSYALYLMSQDYFVPRHAEYSRNTMVSYDAFVTYMKSFEHRNNRLKLNLLSLQADLLKERTHSTGVDFRYLMQADFVLFIRKEVENVDQSCCWWPYTLIYIEHFNSAFEIFARSISKSYFNKVKELILIEKPQDLESLLTSYRDKSRKLPSWSFNSFDPVALLGYKELATKP